ncbi:MAG: 4-hydroxy-tetrahydrodipicolinate reductase [Anaerovoracaceae bacterium]
MKTAVLGGGAMGAVLSQMIEERDGFELAGVIDPLKGQTLSDLDEAEVVIDFSNPANLEMLKSYCEENHCAAVIATTGFSDEQLSDIERLGTKVPVVFSANYSLGINIMKRVLAEITPVLEDTFDIEIVEKHHNKKLDAPSGTAKMLLDAVDPGSSYEHIFGREGNRRRGREIGVHAVRGGTIAGEHTVIFAGNDEIFEIKHTANSKKIFAAGALKAAEFTQKINSGFYTMEEVLFG